MIVSLFQTMDGRLHLFHHLPCGFTPVLNYTAWWQWHKSMKKLFLWLSWCRAKTGSHAAFHWTRNLVITSFIVGNSVPHNSGLIIRSREVGKIKALLSFRNRKKMVDDAMLNGIRVYDFFRIELSNLFFCALLCMFPLNTQCRSWNFALLVTKCCCFTLH